MPEVKTCSTTVSPGMAAAKGDPRRLTGLLAGLIAPAGLLGRSDLLGRSSAKPLYAHHGFICLQGTCMKLKLDSREVWRLCFSTKGTDTRQQESSARFYAFLNRCVCRTASVVVESKATKVQ